MIDVLRSQLLALQAQIAAMLAVIDSVQGADGSTEAPLAQCPHLETENLGTFGAPEYRCLTCKASVPAPAG